MFIVAAAITIATTVATIVVALATVLAGIIAYIVSVITLIGAAVVSVATTVITTLVSTFISVASFISEGIMTVYLQVQSTLHTVYNAVSILSKAVYAGVKAFLKAIHFKTLMKIHKIAMLVSPSYRKMMAKIYKEISRCSYNMQLGLTFLNTMLNDARNVVLDVSSIMGRPYDLSQVNWLYSMNGFLQEIGGNVNKYTQNPAAVIDWLNQKIYKPSLDAKASFQAHLFTILETSVEVVDNMVDKVINLRENVDQTILHLPSSISEKIYNEINPHLESFDKFIEDEYRPIAKNVSNILDVLTDTTRSQTDKLGLLTDSILNPGDLLSNIDHLPELERLRQEAQIGEISTRSTNREMGKINEEISDAYKGLSEIFAASVLIVPPAPYHVPEIKGLYYPIGAIPAGKKSWFVGDF